MNFQRKKQKKPEYTQAFLKKKMSALKEFFLVTRNEKCQTKMTDIEFYNMVYRTPTILANSLHDKIIPAMNNLDQNPNVGMENATHIVKEDAIILC